MPALSSLRSLLFALSLFGVGGGSAQAQPASSLPDYVISTFGHPPEVPSGALSVEVAAAVEVAVVGAVESGQWGDAQAAALEVIAEAGDPRVVWWIADLMRFVPQRELNEVLRFAAARLLEADLTEAHPWGQTTDHLIAWDIPAPPDYLRVKRAIFTNILEGWDGIFVEGDIDWRHVSWGGVRIDARPYDTTDEPCNCIPAADNPEVETAAEATWLRDSDIVFGIEVNGEARAYPRRIMEVREMVNDSLGGRDLGIPYCTLCGAAQAYFTDGLPAGVKRPVLRTSGLLIRSNKVMYDIESGSVFDTFLGRAVTGPLADRGVVLAQASVITTDWGTWKAAYPETTVVAERYALGRDPDFRNTRDAQGPIFPIGDADPRLPVHEDVLGVITGAGQPVAFQVSEAVAALAQGRAVAYDDVRLALVGGGVKAVDSQGRDLGSHQAFWFAWSQFHPETALWVGE